jgi:hypothetical protein
VAGGCWLLAVGRWLLAVGCWLLAVGCWLLAVGCWLLAVGCWLLKKHSREAQVGVFCVCAVAHFFKLGDFLTKSTDAPLFMRFYFSGGCQANRGSLRVKWMILLGGVGCDRPRLG